MVGTPKAAGTANGGQKPKDGRVAETRELILSTAERLFAEHGVVAVSNRQISEEAGLGNNAAVGYHFGPKTDLVRSVVRRRTDEMERLRSRMVAEIGDSDQARDWVAGMVRPYVWHLAELGSPTWFGRFGAQVLTDPAYREIMVVESLHASSLVRVMEGLNRCLPDMPGAVRLQRQGMSRQLLVHVVADRERALAAGESTPQDSWDEAATGLIDAIIGMWFAPVTGRPESPDPGLSRIEVEESKR